jgi:transcriptional regulator with XRE-family HTH domain
MRYESQFKRIREARGLTQEEVARAIGVGQSMISHHEVGRRMLSMAALFRAQERLGFSLEEMLKDYEGQDASQTENMTSR